MAQQNLYETTFIVNAVIDDPQIDATIAKVQETITKHGGEIVELTKWGRKRFAFPIRKKNNGFYVVSMFKATGDVIARLERHFQLEENILRFLIIHLDKKSAVARIPGSELAKLGTAAPVSTGSTPTAATPAGTPDTEKPVEQTPATQPENQEPTATVEP
jgi:small subunit ribosomal protein S6